MTNSAIISNNKQKTLGSPMLSIIRDFIFEIKNKKDNIYKKGESPKVVQGRTIGRKMPKVAYYKVEQ